MDEEVVLLNSDSDGKPSPPKQRSRSLRLRGKRGRKRGSTNVPFQSNRNIDSTVISVDDETSNDTNVSSTSNSNVLVFIDEVETSLNVSNDQVVSRVSPEPAEENYDDKMSSTFSSSIEKPGEISIEGDHETKKSNKPKKTARRGLAKKITSEMPTDSISQTSSHHINVYSSCVSRRHKGFFDVWSKSSELEKNKLMEEDGPETKDTCTDKNTDIAVTIKPSEHPIDDPDPFDEVDTAPEAIPVQIRSPTPPPEMESLVSRTRKPRMTKKLSKALQILNSAKENNTETTTSRRSSRRKGARQMQDTSVVIVDVESPQKTDMVVKIRYLSTIHRINVKLTEPFHTLLSMLSEELGEEEHNLALFLRDESLPLNGTPRSVGLTIADILECHSIKAVEDQSEDSIQLFVQFPNRKKRVEITTNKKLPLQCLIQKLALQNNLPSASFYLSFDGDNLNTKDTPLKLDMDDGDVLDLILE